MSTLLKVAQMSHSYYRWHKCHDRRNVMVGQTSGRTNVGGTNISGTNVSGTKVAPPFELSYSVNAV
jgi:hypothetical protein